MKLDPDGVKDAAAHLYASAHSIDVDDLDQEDRDWAVDNLAPIVADIITAATTNTLNRVRHELSIISSGDLASYFDIAPTLAAQATVSPAIPRRRRRRRRPAFRNGETL